MRSCKLWILAMGMAVCFQTGAMAASSLGIATPYNVFTFGDFTANGGDVVGRLAAGGTVTVGGWSVGQDPGCTPTPNCASNMYTLIAGVDVKGSGGTVNYGNVWDPNTATPTGLTVNNGVVNHPPASAPIDFSGLQLAYKNYANTLSQLTTTGTAVGTSALTITATSSGLNVFNITAANLAVSTGLTINNVSGGTILINVDASGTKGAGGVSGKATVTGGETLNSFANGNVLFNFYNATSFAVSSMSFNATVLAPGAAFTGSNGNLAGTLIAASSSTVNTSFEFHSIPFTGSGLPPVPVPTPEPGTVGMATVGVTLLILGIRRKA